MTRAAGVACRGLGRVGSACLLFVLFLQPPHCPLHAHGYAAGLLPTHVCGSVALSNLKSPRPARMSGEGSPRTFHEGCAGRLEGPRGTANV